ERGSKPRRGIFELGVAAGDERGGNRCKRKQCTDGPQPRAFAARGENAGDDGDGRGEGEQQGVAIKEVGELKFAAGASRVVPGEGGGEGSAADEEEASQRAGDAFHAPPSFCSGSSPEGLRCSGERPS